MCLISIILLLCLAVAHRAARKGGAPDPPTIEDPAAAPGSPAPAPGSSQTPAPAPAPGSSQTPAPAPGSNVSSSASIGSMSVDSNSVVLSDIEVSDQEEKKKDQALEQKIDNLVGGKAVDLDAVVEELGGENKRKERPTDGEKEEPGYFPKIVTTDDPEYMVTQLSDDFQLELARIKQEQGVEQRDKRLAEILNGLVALLSPEQQAAVQQASGKIAQAFELLKTFSQQNLAQAEAASNNHC